MNQTDPFNAKNEHLFQPYDCSIFQTVIEPC